MKRPNLQLAIRIFTVSLGAALFFLRAGELINLMQYNYIVDFHGAWIVTSSMAQTVVSSATLSALLTAYASCLIMRRMMWRSLHIITTLLTVLAVYEIAEAQLMTR